jgi:formate dehydrogenase major subunit
MDVSRRGFLKLSGVSLTALATGIGFDPEIAQAKGYALKIEGTKKISSICHFCSGGCGLLLYIKDEKLIHLAGDPDHPTNSGTLCPKAASLRHVAYSKDRVIKPMRRAPGSDKWEEISWDEAIDKVAKQVKEVRDKTWKATEDILNVTTGQKETFVVNRAEGIAVLGSAEVDNEESYLIKKLSMIWGTPFNEHQARI